MQRLGNDRPQGRSRRGNRPRRSAVRKPSNRQAADRKDSMPQDRGAGVRHELIARIRAEIASGQYDTQDRLETAFFMMMQQLTDR